MVPSNNGSTTTNSSHNAPTAAPGERDRGRKCRARVADQTPLAEITPRLIPGIDQDIRGFKSLTLSDRSG